MFPAKPRASSLSEPYHAHLPQGHQLSHLHSIFPPAASAEPALSASDFLAGKSARPKLIDLETKAISTSSDPIAAAPSPAPVPTSASTPTEPTKSKSAPAAYATPTPPKQEKEKEEPKSAFKEEFTPISTPAVMPKLDAEHEPEAKSLEIDQPESEDEQPAVPAPAASKSEPSVKEVPAPSSNGQVAAVSRLSFPNT